MFSALGVGTEGALRVRVGCRSVTLGDGFGNEVIDQWESGQICGLSQRE